MFALIDSNHLRELISLTSALGRRLRDRIKASGAEVFVGIVVVEEAMQGWLALLKRRAPGLAQVDVYARMQESLEAAVKLGVLPFDDDGGGIFVGLRRALPQDAQMDPKIAAICLAHDAMLLTRNVEDFAGIPGLRVENWPD